MEPGDGAGRWSRARSSPGTTTRSRARRAFEDDPDPNVRGRLEVRAWIQVLRLERDLDGIRRTARRGTVDPSGSGPRED